MKHKSLLVSRALSLCVTFVLVCTAVLTVSIPSAYADRVTLFDADFDNASIGALSDTLAVDVGAVVPEEGNVSIIGLRSGDDDDDDDLTTADDDDDNGSSRDRALAVDGTDGQATALLQWSNYPDSLPISTTEEIELRVRGSFFALSDDVGGTSFGLFSGGSFFEFFSFGSNGQLTRNGESLGLSYRGSSGGDDDDDDDGVAITDDDDDNGNGDDDDDNGNGDYLTVSLVRLDVRLVLNDGNNRAEIIIITTDGRRELNISLDAAFTLETLNQFRFQAPAGSAAAAVTDLNVRLSSDDDDDDDDDDPPAVIIIRNTNIVQQVVIINNQVFVNVNITIVNTGGKARGSFLVFNLRDDDDDDDDDLEDFFDLADVIFIEGVGFVSSIENGQVRIGLGQNNIISSNGTVQVQLQFKLKDNIRFDDDDDDDDDNGDSARISVDVDFNLSFDDTSGEQSIAFPPIVVVVPDDIAAQLPDDDDDDNGDDFGATIVRLPIESIDSRLRVTWDTRGGLDIFGFPVTEAVLLESGITVQYFERARLEYHPDLAGTEFEVLIGLLGVELGYRVPPSVLNIDDLDDDDALWYYPETGHVIGESFRGYWSSRGGLALFGYPISAVVVENGREVQYFERTRMELWPENSGTPYEVQLGFLGLLSLEADDDD